MTEHPCCKATGLVADTTILGGRDVIGLLAERRHTVVARSAVIHDARVIKHRGEKTGGAMTHTAILGSGYVRHRLTYGCCAVVAGGTIITDARVVEYRRKKRRGGVAKVTILVGWQMVYCRILTRGKLTVVTTVAAIGNALMIKHTGGETGGDMAHRAIFCGGNMIYRLADRRHTIMARCAVIHDTRMIEHRREKTAGYVTDAAIFSGRKVTDVLTDS